MSDEDEDQLQEKQGEKKWGNNTSYNEPPLRRRITSNTPGGNLMSSPILVMEQQPRILDCSQEYVYTTIFKIS